MKKKLALVIMISIISIMLFVGCGEKGTSINQNNITENSLETMSEEEVAENVDEEKQVASESEFEFEEQDGEMVLVKYNGSASSVTVPDNYGGKEVTIIGDRAFNQNESIEEVILSEKVTQIGESAFLMCKNLKTVSMGDNVSVISDEAFYMCSKMENINFTDTIIEIGKSAFANTAIKELSIPSGLSILNEGVFSACFNLEKVIIPANVKKIDTIAFDSCTKLKEVEITEGVEYIGEEAFDSCENLEIIKIPASVIEIDEYAFPWVNTTIIAPAGSYAEQYAAEQEIAFQAQ